MHLVSERPCQASNDVNCYVSFGTFQSANVCPVQPRQIAELFLAEAFVRASAPQIRSEQLSSR